MVAVCRVPLNLITIPSARATPTAGAGFFFFGLASQVAFSPESVMGYLLIRNGGSLGKRRIGSEQLLAEGVGVAFVGLGRARGGPAVFDGLG